MVRLLRNSTHAHGGVVTTQFAGIVLRASSRQDTATFYEALGFTLNEHQHGGPLHFEVHPMSSDIVVEIYTASPTFRRDALMVEVSSIEETLRNIESYGDWRKDVVQRGDMKFVYVADPDGRPVMLLEKK